MKSKLSLLVGIAACAAIQGCGNDSEPMPPPPAAPLISGLAAQSISQDTSTGALSFQLSDADSDVSQIAVTARAVDTALVPAAGIVLGGNGAMRTLNITPAEDAKGVTSIVVRAVDAGGYASEQTFTLTVNAVTASFRSSANDAYAVMEVDAPRAVSGFTFTPDADDDPAAFDALLQ
jgi:hypothetical protein